MSEPEVIDGELVDESPGDLVPVQRHGSSLQVAPEVTAQDLVRRLDVIRDTMRNAMERDIDYGVIPGTGSKPTLLKPGSEKLGVLFQLDIQIESEKLFDGPHLTVISKATVYHAPSGTRLGMGEGLCSTREAKYGYRNQNRTCPVCGQEAIIKGKAEYGGGWVCFKKRDGCGAKFADDDPQIVGQKVGRVENPELPETWNTVLKMAEKRARIDAVLAVTGASALFTQDVGDDDAGDEKPPKPDVRSDGKQAAKPAKSWAEWDARMTALDVTQPLDWLRAASEAVGDEDKRWGGTLSQRANRVLLYIADNEPAGLFITVPEIQNAFALAFDGVVVEKPEPPPPETAQ